MSTSNSHSCLTAMDVHIGCKTQEELRRILETIEKNDTLESLTLHSGVLCIRFMHALYEALRSHPSVQKLAFRNVRFAELSRIVFAILENDRLTSLTLSECHVPSLANTTQELKILLQKDALECLSLERYSFSQGDSLDPSALANAKRLRELRLSGLSGSAVRAEVTSNTVSGITQLLRSNPDIPVLDLSIQLTSQMVKTIAQAATGHPSLQELTLWTCVGGLEQDAAQAVGTMVGNTPGMQLLNVDMCFMDPVAPSPVFDGLKSKQRTVESLRVEYNNIGDDGAVALKAALATNSSVKHLYLSGFYISHVGASALGRALTRNETSEGMCLLHNNNIGSRGTEAIANGLSMNHSMNWIILPINGMGNDTAVAMAHMLTTNKTLLILWIGNLGEQGMNAFIECLPQIQGLRHLQITNMDGFTTDTANALLCALEKNTKLTLLDLYENYPQRNNNGVPPPAFVEILPKVEYLLALNHGGRRVLEASPSITPDLLVGNARANKRKRGILSSLWASALDYFGSRKRLRHS